MTTTFEPLLSDLVLSNLVLATLFGGVAWLVGRGGDRARLAHVLWVACFVKLITPPILVVPIQMSLSGTGLALLSIDGRLVVAAVWLVGFAAVLARGIVRFVRFRGLIRREGTRDAEAESFVRSLVGDRAWYSPHVYRLPIRVSPMLFGFGFHPVIVCPEQLWTSLSSIQRKSFLAHEAAHFCRRDHLVRGLEWMVTAAYWWFPGVHWARVQLERHEEACCDAWAVNKLGVTPRQYVEGLLRVVDFISNHAVGLPRLASGMQPTGSLEERIRLLVRRRGVAQSSHVVNGFAGAACIALWLIHPSPRAEMPSTIASAVRSGETTLDIERDADHGPAQMAMSVRAVGKLPDVPHGYWNRVPARQWANFSLELPGATFVADVEHGILIEPVNREPIAMTHHELMALAQIPSTGRVVIGDDGGQVKLWDLAAGVPVSLVGHHAAAVTSLAMHEHQGLVSGDQNGSVMKWDIQSGQVLATRSFATRVQSIRYAGDGQTLAIVVGGWEHDHGEHRVHLVASESLDEIETFPLSCATALVMSGAECDWVTVDWSGATRCLKDSRQLARISKDQVSSLVFSSPIQPFTFVTTESP